ncbi:MAG: TRAP transporter large permease [Phycisphaerae bacterium]|nr:TRAP transporter large permease [Phycisphaerae bacterium]
MDISVWMMILAFFALLVLRVPIAIAIGLSTALVMLTVETMAPSDVASTISIKFAAGVESFPLLAIPFFVLSGALMGEGGMARRLIRLAKSFVGWIPGGLAYVNTLTCMMFGSISGSAAAAVSSVGGFMIPEMEKAGYDKDFSVALTTTAATTGLLIPPSNVMVVYSLSAQVSVAAMFLAGVLPGILTGLALIAASALICSIKGYGRGASTERFKFSEVIAAFKDAGLSLILVVIIMGGILSGTFSPTESSAIAVLYSFIIAVFVYKEVKLADMQKILLGSAITTAVVMFLVGISNAMGWVLTFKNIPQEISIALTSLSTNKIVILLIINAMLLIVGTFMDMTPAVLIFTPILLPVVKELGVDPIHFGIIMIANLCIGLCTPPVGTCLFIGCSVGKTTITKVVKPLLPLFLAMIISLVIITIWPELSTWLAKFA